MKVAMKKKLSFQERLSLDGYRECYNKNKFRLVFDFDLKSSGWFPSFFVMSIIKE